MEKDRSKKIQAIRWVVEYSRGGFGLFEGCFLYLPYGIYRFIILCIFPVYIGCAPFLEHSIIDAVFVYEKTKMLI